MILFSCTPIAKCLLTIYSPHKVRQTLISPLDDDTFADAMRLAQSFRMLAVLLDRLAGDYLGPATHYTNGTRCATSGHRVANLLATLSRMLADTTGLQFHAATTHVAVQRIDSS